MGWAQAPPPPPLLDTITRGRAVGRAGSHTRVGASVLSSPGGYSMVPLRRIQPKVRMRDAQRFCTTVTTPMSISNRQHQSNVLQPPREQHPAYKTCALGAVPGGWEEGSAHLSLGSWCPGAPAVARDLPSTGGKSGNPRAKQLRHTEQNKRAQWWASLGLRVALRDGNPWTRVWKHGGLRLGLGVQRGHPLCVSCP